MCVWTERRRGRPSNSGSVDRRDEVVFAVAAAPEADGGVPLTCFVCRAVSPRYATFSQITTQIGALETRGAQGKMDSVGTYGLTSLNEYTPEY